jgi:hypothetical protein
VGIAHAHAPHLASVAGLPRARPAWRGWNEHRIAEHKRFAASLRSRIDPTFDTSTRSIEEVADQVARWVTSHLR